jgi:hypothetical protein
MTTVNNSPLNNYDVADESIANRKYQMVKLIDGTPGSVTPIGTASNPLNVTGSSGGSSAPSFYTDVGADAAEAGSTTTVINAVGHAAHDLDAIQFDSSAAPAGETSRVESTTANTITVTPALTTAPLPGDIFTILRPSFVTVSDDGSAEAIHAAYVAQGRAGFSSEPWWVRINSSNPVYILAAGFDNGGYSIDMFAGGVASTTNQGGFVGVQIEGTWTGTITFQAKQTGSAGWVSILAKNVTTGTSAATTTANGLFQIDCTGIDMFRLSGAGGGTGTATIEMKDSGI